MIRLLLLGALLLLPLAYWWLTPAPDDDGPKSFSRTVTTVEEPFSFDLSGNMRVTLGTLLSGEDQTNRLVSVEFK